jgi:pentatricopeptide repeat protein
MTGRGHVDVVACNSVLEALRQNRDGDAALQFLQDMVRHLSRMENSRLGNSVEAYRFRHDLGAGSKEHKAVI